MSSEYEKLLALDQALERARERLAAAIQAVKEARQARNRAIFDAISGRVALPYKDAAARAGVSVETIRQIAHYGGLAAPRAQHLTTPQELEDYVPAPIDNGFLTVHRDEDLPPDRIE